MNKYLKFFINTCFLISILFLGLILAEYLFGVSIIIPAIILIPMVISIDIVLPILFIFCLFMLNKNFRELYFKGNIGFYDIIQNVNPKKNFKEQINFDHIRELFSNGEITLEQLQQLNSEGIAALKSNNIRELFINKQITFEQLIQIKSVTRDALEIKNIRDLFVEKRIQYNELTYFNDLIKNNFENDNLKNLFSNNHITLKDYFKIGINGHTALSKNNVISLLSQKKITLNQIKNFYPNAINIFDEFENIRKLFCQNLITTNQLNRISIWNRNDLLKYPTDAILTKTNNPLSYDYGYSIVDRESLRNDNIRDLIQGGYITFDQFRSLTIIPRLELETKNIKELFIQKHITFEEYHQLENFDVRKLRDDLIRELFIKKIITIKEVAQLRLGALSNKHLRVLFINKHMDAYEINKINEEINYFAKHALNISYIRELFVNNHLSFDQLFEINLTAVQALNNENIRNLFIDKKISIKQLNQLDYQSLGALNDDNIRELFKTNHLSFLDLFYINNNAIDVLKNGQIKNLFIRNRITLNQILVSNVQDLLALQQQINTAQSTHTASVHQSVSDSAIALSELYGQDISDDDVKNHISELKSKIEYFSPNETITSHIHEAAKRGLNRLENLGTDDFKDPKSQLSINQLIALTMLAGKDDNYRQYAFNDYLEAMILALYEIQRGKNINDENDIDDMREDDESICFSGTFNKIIEKMVGILPDCHIHYITFDVINFKADQLVKNLISQFVDDRASLDLPNEDELSSLEITQRATYIEHLKDIINSESNHEDNPVFNALNTKLLQDIQSNLENEFGSHFKRHINENFTIEQFIDAILNSETIQTDTNTKIERYIERHQTHKNLINDLSSMFSNRSNDSSLSTATNSFKQV